MAGKQTKPLDLRDFRKASGMTVSEIGRKLDMAVTAVFQNERNIMAGKSKISTVQAYVRALGGSVRIVLDMPGKESIEITPGVGPSAPSCE